MNARTSETENRVVRAVIFLGVMRPALAHLKIVFAETPRREASGLAFKNICPSSAANLATGFFVEGRFWLILSRTGLTFIAVGPAQKAGPILMSSTTTATPLFV